jgi:ABC-type nitrate/sulfonate/bicarbonate transport system substrate-binding protein
MKGKRYWLLGLGLLVLIIAVSSWNFLSRTEDGRRLPPASIRIGTIPGDISAPIFLAQQLGYFSEENLKVDIVLFESGAEAVQSLLEGHVDLASAAEYVFVRQAFENPNLRILGVVATGQITEVLARAARGISQPEDLHGKRIGLVKGTHTEYYLARFLGFYGVPQKEVPFENKTSDP